MDGEAGTQAGDEIELTGRLISDEGPALPPTDAVWEQTRMSPAALLSRWHDIEFDGERIAVYRQYATSDDPTGGLVATELSAISSPARSQRTFARPYGVWCSAEAKSKPSRGCGSIRRRA